MIKTLVLSCFIFISLEVISQDRIVTINGDTLNGKVQIISNSSKLPYSVIRTKDDKITVDFLKTKLIEKLDLGILKPLKINENYKFGLQVSQGYLSWYKFSDPKQGQEYGADLLQKLDGESLEIGGLIGFRKSIIRFIEDCESLVQKIQKKELGRNDLALIVNEYNDFIEKRGERLFTADSEPINSIKNDLLIQFENLLTESDKIEDKTTALQILKDLKEKILGSEQIPQYLTAALKEKISKDEELLRILTKILN